MMALIGSRAAKALWLFPVALVLTGCANLTVTHVTPQNTNTVQGIRYYLPKPYLQVTPKSDGTVSVTVIYLPDTSHEYAVDTSSWASSYSFQIARDPLGLLAGIEYKADTTAVGQQLAASAQAAAVQNYNLNASQLAAVQAQVNTAQTAVDTATANLSAAQAALASDTAKLPSGGTTLTLLATDNSNVEQAMAKLQAAQQVLARTQASSQTVANSISAAAPTSTAAGPTLGTALPAPAPVSTLYNLPSKFGVVLFAVNETATDLSLKAVDSEILGTGVGTPDELHAGVIDKYQRTFDTVGTALGAPTLTPATLTVKLSDQRAIFSFSRAISKLSSDGIVVQTDDASHTSATIPSTPNPLQADNTTLRLDISQLKAGTTYKVTIKFLWPVDSVHSHDITTSVDVRLVVTS